MAVGVNIVSQFDSRGIDKAMRDFKKLGTGGERVGFALKKAMLPAIAAIGAIAVGLGLAAKAAIEDEKSQAMLAKQMQATTGATDAQVKSMETYVTKLSRAAAVADDVLRPAMASLVRSTRSVEEAQKLMTTALDISAATGKDLETVSLTLGKAFNGQYTALMKLDPSIKAAIKSTSSFSTVNDALTKSFGGAAATAAGTMSGQFASLKISIDETKESIGRALMPVIKTILPYLQEFGRWAEDNTGVFIVVGTVIGAIATALIAVKAAMVLANAVSVITIGLNWGVAASATAASTAMTLGVGAAAIAAGLVVAAGAFVAYKNATKDATTATDEFEASAASAAAAINARLASTAGATTAGKRAEMLRWGALAKSFTDVKEKAGGAAKAVESLAAAFKDKLGSALDTAKGLLEKAQDAFTSFADGISNSLTSAFSFGDAQDAGAETGGGFLAGLREQVVGITGYTDKVKQLLEMNLSQESLAAVLAAGQVAGSKIADQLIAGGTTAIDETNALVASMNLAADKVGLNAAGRWFQSGVDQALHMVAGLQAELDKLTPKLMAKMDAIAAKMRRRIDIDVNVTERVNKIVTSLGGIPKMADGGIVTRPTLAMIGEAGAEAVVPLDRLGSTGGGDTHIYNLTINTLTADDKFAEFTVDKLRDLVRRKGSLKLLTT